ncbi:ATP-binding protein [Streptomyces sp. NPDC054961]
MAPPAPVLDQSVPRTGQPTATARDATRSFLRRAAQTRAPTHPENTDAVLLIVAELISNAIRHTDGPCTLHLELHEDHVEIRVTDTSPYPPQTRPPHTDGTGGWGWQLIDYLTTHTHTQPTPGGGKTIYADTPW